MSLLVLRRRAAIGMCVAFCCVSSLVTCVCSGFGRHLPDVQTGPGSSGISVLPARDDGPAGTLSGAQRPPLALTVQGDTTEPVPADLQALATALDGTAPGQALSGGSMDRHSSPDWLVWSHLDGARVPIVLHGPVTFAPNSLGLYAAGNAESKTVCLVNRSQERLQLRVQVRLPRGNYTIERLTLWRPADRHETAMAVPGDASAHHGPTVGSDVDDPPSATPDPLFYLERLQGSDLKRAAVVAKTGVIEPGQVVFYRFTDQCRVVDAAFAEAYRLLAALEQSRPGPSHRLRRMLRDGEPYRSGARPGGRSVEERLENIHRLLLVTGQAQSLHHNYQMRGTVEAEIGAALMGSLERAMDGLAEISATLLGLVPQVRVEPIPGNAAAGNAIPAPTVIGRSAGSRLVTISLANGGEHSVGMVKLGLDSSGLPADVVCDPPDPAFFGVLKPGQTVRAQFRLRCPADFAIVERRCVADVCYRAGGGPAHLRQRPW